MSQGRPTLDAFLARHGATLRRLAERLCPRGMGVEPAEIEQEVRVRLWRTFERERDLREPASYLYRVAAAAAIDAVRRRRARREESLDPLGGEEGNDFPASGASPEAAVLQRELRMAIGSAIASLPEPRQQAVRLHLLGFSTGEIGALAGWTEAKARNLVYRGLADLRGRLVEDGIAHSGE